MSDSREQYNKLIFQQANKVAEVESVIAQIAPGLLSEQSHISTLPQGKYSDPASKQQYRAGYKIFICGEHDEGTPVESLPWASPYGSAGLRNESSFVPALPPNTYVEVIQHGMMEGAPFYWIVNILPNYNTQLDGSKSQAFCTPGSGFVPGSESYFVPEDSINETKTGIAAGSEANISVPNLSDGKQNKDNESIIIPQPVECVKVDTAAINKDIENLLKEIENIRTELLGDDSFIRTSQDFLSQISTTVSETSEKIARHISKVIREMSAWVMRKVNTLVNNTVGSLFLNLRYQVLEANDGALDLIGCLFLKLLDNLASIVRGFLNDFIGKFLGTGKCVVENFLSSLLGNITAQIQNALSQILGPLQNLLGTAVNLIEDVLSFVESILDFLTCDIEQLCPVTNEWNFLDGPIDSSPFSISTFDFDGVWQSGKAVADSITAVGDIPSDLASTNFDIDLAGAVDAAEGCLGGVGGGLFECGPPTVSFWGADGSGATGDIVVNAAGQILGVNITWPGENYTRAPIIQIEDRCGRGTGAYGVAVIGEYDPNDYKPPGGPPPGGDDDGGGGPPPPPGPDDDPDDGGGPPPGPDDDPDDGGPPPTGVVDVIMIKGGYDYIPSKDGSYGGNGRIFAGRCQSVIRRGDTNLWEGPFDEGDVFEVKEGDFVILAGQPPYISEENTTITAPGCPPDPEPGSNPSTPGYNVITGISTVSIINPGFGFSTTDTITVIPDNGAELEPEIRNGFITGVNIIKPGIGFDTLPNITVNTRTGYNAILNPVLRFSQVDDNVGFVLPEGAKVISVIDCVGKN
jgi:gas vesicle protein